MCGIVGAIAERNVVPILVEGLRRLEYRGYDSAGVAILQDDRSIGLCKTVGKVAELEEKLEANPLRGVLGVAHTRWATHGGVTEANAHPHLSGDRVAVIHNGIIENYLEIKDELEGKGYVFISETDTEVAAHCWSSTRRIRIVSWSAVSQARWSSASASVRTTWRVACPRCCR